MKRLLLLPVVLLIIYDKGFTQGKVGINTASPLALLHVKDSSVLFSGPPIVNSPFGDPPTSGAGIRMMWYPAKAAFRVGYVNDDSWDKNNIGTYSFGSGHSALASGSFSTALGLLPVASGTSSVSIGSGTQAFGSNTVAMGTSARAEFSNSISIGTTTRSAGQYSTAMGAFTVSHAYNCFTVGRYNDSISTGSSSFFWNDEDPLFIIGNGSGTNTRSNAITVLKNAMTGINTSAPKAMLHVKDSNVLFSGFNGVPPSSIGNPPDSGAGVRMLWYPNKAAFRAGYVFGTEWNKNNIGVYSFAGGNSNRASGQSSFAMGSSCLASGTNSIAMGSNSEASGNNSFALGNGTVASGTTSFATGFSTEALGPYSTATGRDTRASGDHSFAMGELTVASGENSIVSGWNSDAEGERSIAMGSSVRSRGFAAFATGITTRANGVAAAALGNNTISNGYGGLVIGNFNDSIMPAQAAITSTTPLFMIGNGDDNNSRSNAMTVLKNGFVGINTSSPIASLYMKGTDGSINSHIRLEDNNTTSTGSIYYTGTLFFRNSLAGGNFIFENDTGNNIAIINSTGDLNIDGTLTQNSDVRLKKNIQPVKNSLEKILRLNGYHYNWIETYRNPNLQAGLLAQEIEKVMPELVMENAKGEKSVNYNGFVPYLIEAIKEQQKKIESLEEQINEIRKALAANQVK